MSINEYEDFNFVFDDTKKEPMSIQDVGSNTYLDSTSVDSIPIPTDTTSTDQTQEEEEEDNPYANFEFVFDTNSNENESDTKTKLQNPIEMIIEEIAVKNGKDPNFFKALAFVESGLNPDIDSNTGAQGLFQFIPSTAKSIGLQNPYNPKEATQKAIELIGLLEDKYGDDKEKILTAYNAGPAVVDEAIRMADTRGTNWKEEVGNTASVRNVAKTIARVKGISEDEAYDQKLKEINGHREKIITKYNEYTNKEYELIDFDTFEFAVDDWSEESNDQAGWMSTIMRAGLHTIQSLSAIPGFLAEILSEDPTLDLKIERSEAIRDGNTERVKEIDILIEEHQKYFDAVIKKIDNNPVAKFVAKALDEIPSIQSKHKSVTEAFSKGVPEGLEYMAHVGIENSGTLALLAASTVATGGAGAGVAAIGVGAAGLKNKELKDKIERNELELDVGMRLLNSTLTGAAEALPELITGKFVIDPIKKIFIKTAKEVGTEVAERGLKEFVKTFVKSGLKGWGAEFFEENITSISTIIIDYVTGVSKTPLKKEVKKYITETMPELAASTWIGGAAAAEAFAPQRSVVKDTRTDVTQKPEIELQDQASFIEEGTLENFLEIYNKALESNPEIADKLFNNLTEAEQVQVLEATGRKSEIPAEIAARNDVSPDAPVSQPIPNVEFDSDRLPNKLMEPTAPGPAKVTTEGPQSKITATEVTPDITATEVTPDITATEVTPDITVNVAERKDIKETKETGVTEEEAAKKGVVVVNNFEGVEGAVTKEVSDETVDALEESKKSLELDAVIVSPETKIGDKTFPGTVEVRKGAANVTLPIDIDQAGIEKAIADKTEQLGGELLSEKDKAIAKRTETTVESKTPTKTTPSMGRKVKDPYRASESVTGGTEDTKTTKKKLTKAETRELLKKAPNKFLASELESLSLANVRDIATEAGVSIINPEDNTNLQKHNIINNYITKFPKAENRSRIDVIANQGKRRIDAVKRSGTQDTNKSTDTKYKILRNIIDNNNVVEYDPINHAKLIKNGILEELFTSKDGKKYVGVKDPNKIDLFNNKVDNEKVINRVKEEYDFGREEKIDLHDSYSEYDSVDGNTEYFELKRNNKDSGKTATKKQQDTIKKAVMSKLNKNDVKRIHIIFSEEVSFNDGTKVNLRSDGDTEGFITRNIKTGDVYIHIGNSLDIDSTIRALVHEVWGHYGASKVFATNKKIHNLMRDLFEQDRNSDFTRDIEDRYEKDLMVASKESLDAAEEFLFNEWVAHRIHETRTKYMNVDGTLKNNTPKINKSIWNHIVDFIKSIIGKKSFDEKLNDVIEDLIDAIETSSDLKSITPSALKKNKPQTQQTIMESVRRRSRAKERIGLETLKTIKGFQNRVLKFAINHIKTAAERDKISDLLDKIIDDSSREQYQKKVIDLIDRNLYRKDIGNALSTFTKSFRTQLAKKPKEILEYLNTQKEFGDRVRLWTRLQTFVDSKNKQRYARLNKANGEIIKTGVFGELENAGYIVAGKYTTPRTKETFDVWKLTEKGLEQYGELEKQFNDLTSPFIESKGLDVDDKSVDLLGYLEESTVLIKEKIYKFENTRKEEIKKREAELANKQTNIVYQVKQYVKNKIEIKALKKFDNKITRAIGDLAKRFDVSTVNMEHLTSVIDNYTNGWFTKHIFNPLIQGERDMIKFQKEGMQFIQNAVNKLPKKELFRMADFFNRGGYLKLAQRTIKGRENIVDLYEYESVDGKKFKLTSDHKIALYRLIQQPNILETLTDINGGFSFDQKSSEVYQLDLETIEKITNLTENERIIADAVKDYFDFQAVESNKVSRKTLGYDVANVENYHPISRRKRNLNTKNLIDPETQLTPHQAFINEMVFNNLKNRTKSKSPIVLEGALESIARTNNSSAKFIGLSEPVRDVYALLRSNINEGDKKITMHDFMAKNGLEPEYNELVSTVKKFGGLNNRRSELDGVLKLYKIARGAKTIGVLGNKVSVALLQPISYLASYNERAEFINGKTGGDPIRLTEKNKQVFQEFIDNSYFIWDRFNNHIDREQGEALSSSEARKMLLGDNKIGPINIIDFIKTGKLLTAEGAMTLISRMDAIAIALITRDVANDLTKEGYTYGTKEFWDEAVPRAEQIIRRTQPTFGELHRPSITNIEILKGLTMFTSQPIKNMQLTRKALFELVTGVKERDRNKVNSSVLKLANVLVVQPALVALVREGARSLRGKNEDEEFSKVWLKSYLMSIVGMYPVIGAMLGSVIYDLGKPSFMRALVGAEPVVETVNDMYRFIIEASKAMAGDGDNKRLVAESKRVLTDIGITVGGPLELVESINNVAKSIEESQNGY